MTAPFAPVERARLERLPGVRAVGLYRSGLLEHRRAPRAGDRPAARGDPAAAGGPARAGQPAPGDRARARRRLAGALAGDRRRTRTCTSARRARCRLRTRRRFRDRGAVDQRRLGAGGDRHERLRLRARLGQRGSERLQRAARPRRLAGTGVREIERALGGGRGSTGLAVQTPRSSRSAARAQPRGARAPDADRDADPDRRGARDGRRDGRDGLAAPPAPGEAEARGASRAPNCGARSCWRACCCWASAA